VEQKNYNKALEVNQVKIAFTGKAITAWGGMATVVGKYLEQIGFREWVEKSLPVEEHSNHGYGIYAKVVGQLFTVLAGGERFAHLGWWEPGKEVISQLFGVPRLPKAASTLTRFWGKFSSWKTLMGWGKSVRELAWQVVYWENIREDRIHLDSSVVTRYGHQEGAKKGYNPQKRGRPSHQPLLAFLGRGFVVNLWNRSGDTFSGQRAQEFLGQTLEGLGENFRLLRLLADSGFYLIEFIEWLESQGYSYIIAVPLQEVIQRQVMKVDNWRCLEVGICVGEFIFQHQDPKWSKLRRYVVVRQEIACRPEATGKQLSLFTEMEESQRYRYAVYLTDDVQSLPEQLWREYRPRATTENVIKDLKEGYGLSGYCLHKFWATEAVMLLHSLVFHNLIWALTCRILHPQPPYPQLKTLRLRYFLLPGLLGSGGGYSTLRLAVTSKKQRGKFRYWLEQLQQFPHRIHCIAVESG
jgi:hypothetical protein